MATTGRGGSLARFFLLALLFDSFGGLWGTSDVVDIAKATAAKKGQVVTFDGRGSDAFMMCTKYPVTQTTGWWWIRDDKNVNRITVHGIWKQYGGMTKVNGVLMGNEKTFVVTGADFRKYTAFCKTYDMVYAQPGIAHDSGFYRFEIAECGTVPYAITNVPLRRKKKS